MLIGLVRPVPLPTTPPNVTMTSNTVTHLLVATLRGKNTEPENSSAKSMIHLQNVNTGCFVHLRDKTGVVFVFSLPLYLCFLTTCRWKIETVVICQCATPWNQAETQSFFPPLPPVAADTQVTDTKLVSPPQRIHWLPCRRTPETWSRDEGEAHLNTHGRVGRVLYSLIHHWGQRMTYYYVNEWWTACNCWQLFVCKRTPEWIWL